MMRPDGTICMGFILPDAGNTKENSGILEEAAPVPQQKQAAASQEKNGIGDCGLEFGMVQ